MPGEQKKVCIDVPYIDQSKLYPTGCESVSTVMLLRFLGIDITVDEFIEKYLEKKSFEERDGRFTVLIRIGIFVEVRTMTSRLDAMLR
mgnify:CR=1 FL=1